jgi:DNA transposition AAA+ family ATPase
MKRELTDEVCGAARERVRRLLANRPDLTAEDLAQHTTLAASTIRLWLSGGMPGGREVVGQMVRVAELVEAGEVLAPGGRPETVVLTEDTNRRVVRIARRGAFYETQLVRRVAEVCDYCASNAQIGVVTSGFGNGKTEAVAAWRRKTAGKVESLVLELDEYIGCNKVDFICTLARTLGTTSLSGSVNGGRAFRDVCDKLRESPSLLVFDQGEVARARIMQVIRQIHDRTADAGVGVVILAAPVLLARLSKLPDLGALASRVAIYAPLAGLSRDEMAAIVKQEGITDVEDAAFDFWWKATGGSMRRLMRTIDLLKSKHGGRRVTEKTLSGVGSMLWGMNLGSAA